MMKYERDEALIGVTKLYSVQYNERNDCFVVAVSMVTGKPYGTIWEAMKRKGRRRRCGTPLHIGESVLNMFRFRVRKVKPDDHDKRRVKAGKNILSRHFNEKNAPHFVKKYGKAFIAFSKRHAIPVINGIAHDWSYEKSLRITEIWIIEDMSYMYPY